MIILNLGCGHPGEDMPAKGFVNLDKNPKYGDHSGWKAEDGLKRWADGTVDAVTISHLMMYVPLHTWNLFFDEVYRVLKPGGIVRITEDIIDRNTSRHWAGHKPLHQSWNGRITDCSPARMIYFLGISNIWANEVEGNETRFIDANICQNRHGGPPHVFFVEGVKR